MKINKLPKMIMFDQGGTLIKQSDWWSAENGNRAQLKYILSNPYGYTDEEILKRASEVFTDDIMKIKTAGYDFKSENLTKALFESLGIELSVTYDELEKVFWDNCTDCTITDGIDSFLDFLYENGIRTSVLSNLGYGEKTLKSKIDELLPNNHFEFTIASSEYVLRKPSPILYEIAVKKSGLKPDEIWYCGDNVKADVIGSHNAGMIPVFYDCGKSEAYVNNTEVPDFDYIHINSWSELEKIIKQEIEK